jgi:hypothetical protein
MRKTLKQRLGNKNYTVRRKTRGGEGKLEKALTVLKKSGLRDYNTPNNYTIFYNVFTKPNFPGNQDVQKAINTIKDIAKILCTNKPIRRLCRRINCQVSS